MIYNIENSNEKDGDRNDLRLYLYSDLILQR